jgi:hypothetical protein
MTSLSYIPRPSESCAPVNQPKYEKLPNCIYPANNMNDYELFCREISNIMNKNNSYYYFSMYLLKCKFNKYSSIDILNDLKFVELIFYFNQFNNVDENSDLGKRIKNLLFNRLYSRNDSCADNCINMFGNALINRTNLIKYMGKNLSFNKMFAFINKSMINYINYFYNSIYQINNNSIERKKEIITNIYTLFLIKFVKCIDDNCEREIINNDFTDICYILNSEFNINFLPSTDNNIIDIDYIPQIFEILKNANDDDDDFEEVASDSSDEDEEEDEEA